MNTPFRRIRQGMAQGLRLAFNFLLPPTCPGCQLPLPGSEPMAFCATCYGNMPWWNTAQVLPPKLPPAIASFTAPCLYAGPLRSAILQLKFHHGLPYAIPLAKLLVPHMPVTPMLILPVPAHPSRVRKRHYNHMAVIARYLVKHSPHTTHATALKRLNKDTPQAHKTRAARLKLSAQTFAANPAVVAGKSVLLIDDIYTTGATARACALALKKAGATSVHVLTLAYTAPG